VRFFRAFQPSSIVCSISLIRFSICAIISNPYLLSSSLFIAIATSLSIFASYLTCFSKVSICWVDVDFFNDSREFLAVAINSLSSSSEAWSKYSSQFYLSSSTLLVSCASFALSLSYYILKSARAESNSTSPIYTFKRSSLSSSAVICLRASEILSHKLASLSTNPQTTPIFYSLNRFPKVLISLDRLSYSTWSCVAGDCYSNIY
jgi:hypothetical protein